MRSSGARRRSPALLDQFLAADWPGNVRQLENMVHRGVVLSADRETIEPGDVTHAFLNDAAPIAGGSLAPRSLAVTTLDEMERQMILQALTHLRQITHHFDPVRLQQRGAHA